LFLRVSGLISLTELSPATRPPTSGNPFRQVQSQNPLHHQRLAQIQPAVLDALYGATAIKFASKISDAAAHALARDMHTTPEFILNQPPYHFAAYVRGFHLPVSA
jgi:hypothetical protein